MKAQEFIDRHVIQEEQENAHVIAVKETSETAYTWWHVHKDEELPTGEGVFVAIKFREPKEKEEKKPEKEEKSVIPAAV